MSRIRLYDRGSGDSLGEITEDQLQFLIDLLEEESLGDQDYYIDGATVEWFEEEGAEAGVLSVLRKALADREDREIRWERG